MKIKTSNLTGVALDWAVAKAEGMTLEGFSGGMAWVLNGGYVAAEKDWNPSDDWAQGGPIIQREEISINRDGETSHIWAAWTPAPLRDESTAFGYGDTPLIAAMRCYVASKLGDEIEVPDELT